MSGLRPTVIAVASGKGGTGKTTIAVHLALAAARSGDAILVDLDVEAPDVTGYFPEACEVYDADKTLSVTVSVPQVVEDRCTGCGRCARSCRFGAILAIGGVVTTDSRICKGCGRCVVNCPVNALTEVSVQVGTTSVRRAFLNRQSETSMVALTGTRFANHPEGTLSSSRVAGSVTLCLVEGKLAVGDIRATAVIEATKQRAAQMDAVFTIRDCPPGVSCPATHAVEGADYLVLVAEPTEFSLHDLDAAIRLAASLGIPTGVVVNKDGFGDADIDTLCARHGIPVIGRIAFTQARAASGAGASRWEGDMSVSATMIRILEHALKAADKGDASW